MSLGTSGSHCSGTPSSGGSLVEEVVESVELVESLSVVVSLVVVPPPAPATPVVLLDSPSHAAPRSAVSTDKQQTTRRGAAP